MEVTQTNKTDFPSIECLIEQRIEMPVIGIYGISGSGKTTLINRLEQMLGQNHFKFFEGSTVLKEQVGVDSRDFESLLPEQKRAIREQAIQQIVMQSNHEQKIAVVTGHFSFWPDCEHVLTEADWRAYNHIFYLDVRPEEVFQRRENDTGKLREVIPLSELRDWQEHEKSQMPELCKKHSIIFEFISSSNTTKQICDKLENVLESHILSLLKEKLSIFVKSKYPNVETMLVFDGDRTLAPQDTGMLFWKQYPGRENSLKELFGNPPDYSNKTFRQAVTLYEEVETNATKFDLKCEEVAQQVAVYPELQNMLTTIVRFQHVGAIVLTCGLQRIWEKVLKNANLSETVKVIGAISHINDKHCAHVVTASTKAALVESLQNDHGMYVCAFGDSSIDLDMLKQADKAFVIVGEEDLRSKTMEQALKNAIDADGLRAQQILLPPAVSPRLDSTKLPVRSLQNGDFADLLSARRLKMFFAPVYAAKLLATPMRNADTSGPDLRIAHCRTGYYLATHFLPCLDIVGLEEYEIPHVQGRSTDGYRLHNEARTTIIPLMRGGEPMGFGVNDAFPTAMFQHAKEPTDIEAAHINHDGTVILVDAVINSGKSIAGFVHRIRELSANVKIVIVAGVVHGQAISPGGGLVRQLSRHENRTYLVALRVSERNFIGKRETDTGNRLFNTTHLD